MHSQVKTAIECVNESFKSQKLPTFYQVRLDAMSDNNEVGSSL